MPSETPDPALLWSEAADRILAKPTDKAQLLLLARIAGRVQIQALIQHGQWKDEGPDDDVLLTPAETAKERGVKEYTVREAMRRGDLKPWRPYPGATRGLMVRRGQAKAWAAKLVL